MKTLPDYELKLMRDALRDAREFLTKPEVIDNFDRSGAFTTGYGQVVIDLGAALALAESNLAEGKAVQS